MSVQRSSTDATYDSSVVIQTCTKQCIKSRSESSDPSIYRHVDLRWNTVGSYSQHILFSLNPTTECRGRAGSTPVSWFSLLLFFIILSGVRLSPLGTAATTGLLYQPQMIDDGDCGAIGAMNIGRGSRSTGENLSQFHFVHRKSHMPRTGLEAGAPRWEASD
jgi:hypothetical protein